MLAVLALALAACGQGASPTTSGAGSSPDVTAAPNGVVLQIDQYGGFTASPRSRWLNLALLDDGTLVQPERAIPLIYPGFLYVGLQQGKPAAAQVSAVLAAAPDAVVDGADYTDLHVADAPTTRVRWWDGTKYRTTTAYGLGLDGGEAPASLAAFVERAQALADSVMAGSDQYTAASLEVWSTPAGPDPEFPDAKPVVWPGHTKLSAVVPTAVSGPDAPRCHVESDPGAVLSAVTTAQVNTRWKDATGAKTWTLDVVPLLPGEKGCTSELRK